MSFSDFRGPAFLTLEREWTHAEVHALGARAATVLARRGVGPGSRVLIALPDGVGFVVTFLACARLGAVAVMVNPALPPADHATVVADCSPVLVVSSPAMGFACFLDVAEVLSAWEEPAAAVCQVSVDTPLYVHYTSGTTGQPRGAVHCHGDLAVYHRTASLFRLSAKDVVLSVPRLHFAYGFGNSLVYPLFSGCAAVLVAERPSVDDVLALAARFKPTLLFSVPSALAHLAASGAPFSVRACVSAGEALTPVVHAAASAFLNAPVIDGIGSTEVGSFYCMNTLDTQVHGTLGWPVPGYSLDVRDGRLWVRGPGLFRGYLNGPARSGWFATGDRACLVDGTYRYLGRDDDMEVVGGITLSPLEVERVLAEHPGVAEVAVAAVQDSVGATKLHAFVVPRADVSSPELIALARQRLAAFKVPRVVRLVDSLPRTSTGKVRRFILRRGSW